MSSPENENLSVRIVTADYYLQKPIPELGDQCYSAFRSLPIYRVPVIRIFGPTADGVKTCLHIHGVFPYIFVPNWNHQVREKELYNFAVNLDKAINTSFAHSNSKSSHVHKITQVSGIPFYGYHESEKDFLKIEFYNPAMVKRASELLLNGAVLNTIFQPHESHIPYILQFFIDNNLYGMNNIAFSSYKLRNNVAQDVINLNDTIIRSSSNVNQQSYSTLEIDITVSNICNASSNQGNVPNNPGLAFIWEDEKKRRRFNQKSSQITPNESQQRPEKPVTRTECYFREKLMRKLKAIKDNETCMDLDHDETPSLNATFEELNTQSKSLLEILQNLANEQEKSKDAGCSRSSSPSLVFSDDENNVAEVSLLSSQPLLKFNAEDDSILGNNFSEDENDIDDHDHQTLSQTMTYSTHQNMSSSDDSGSEIGGIPQLDGACDVKITKKSAAKKIKPSRSKKISSGVENQDNSINKRRYNLRSKDKVPEKSSCKNENFQPKDFKIILQKLDHAKISPKKTYPRLQIDAQKSPRSNHSRSSQDSFDGSCKEPILLVPQLDEDSFKETASSVPETRNDTLEPSLPMSPSIKSADTSSLQRSDKKVYPPLDITIKKSPKSAQKLPSVEEVKPSRPVASVHCLKKRKINFGDDESEVARTKETIPNSDLIGPKWKKSLKRRKKDDTSFKIGDSFSLLQFRKFKKNPSMEKISEKLITSDSFANTCDKSRQNYSLRISNSVPFTSCSASTHDKSAERNDSVEMESLHISDDDEGANGGNKEQYCAENNDQLAKLEVLAAPLPMSDEELTEAAPPSIVQKDEAKLQKDSLIEPSSDSQIHKVPVLKIPRIDPDMLSDSGSLIFYENSSIELNISEPNEECTKMNRDPSLETSKIEEKIESCSKHIPTDVEELHQVTEKNSKATTSSHNNSNSTKVPSKKAAVKKKSLGMRIRKKTNQVTPSHSKLDRKSSAALEKIECEADKKSTVQLPIMLVDQERDQNTSLATPLDSYPDSNIVLNITKCSQDRPSKSPNNETNNLKTKSTPNLATSRQHISNSANSADASCQIDVPKNSTKLSSPLTFEDSQLELDIFKFCSSEESTKENQRTPEYVENRNLATPPVYENQTYADSLNRRNEENRNLSKSPSIFNDVILSKRNAPLSDAAIGRRERVGSPEVVFEENSTANENLPASQSIFCDQLPIASNTNLLDILFDNSDHFFNRKNVVKPNLTRNENPTSSRSVLGKNISDISSTSLPKQLVDDQDTYFNQENAPELKNNANSNLAKSPTLFSDECSGESIAKSLDPSTKLDKNNRTTTTIENNDLNTSCSNDSLFNVLESLTPKTKEALNRKLDSFVGDENVATSQTSKHSLTTSAAPICDLEKAITEIELFENVSDASVAIVDLPTESSSRANCKNYVSVDLCTPDILDKAAYTISNSGVSTKSTPGPVREQVLFEEDSFDLELSATCDQEQPVNRTPALDKLLLNNSIWDSMDDDDDLSSQEDNEIMSFYNDQTINPAHITVIRDIADEDTDDSSPIAKALTPESQTSNEILSFYGSQSPESMICSISQDVIKPAAAKSTPSTRSTAAASSPLLPHITPAGSSTKKTSSPLYTPTLKRLMLKKVNDNDKRRVSSQRFRSEPFLSEITEQEEDEEGKKKKEFDKNTSFSLPLELECDVSKIDGKSALNTSKTSTCSGASYQIDGATLDNTCGFKMNLENLQDIKTDKQFQFITLISLEIFAQTRADLKPDPEYDPVTCLFYSIHHDAPNFPNLVSGIIVVSENALPADLNRFKSQKMVVSSEAELFDAFLTLIRKWDPDMFIGYEVEMLSWGFLIQRGHFLGRNLIQELSRVRETKQNEPTEKPTYEDDEYSNELKLPGRIVLNVWRLMRHEVNLQSYTFENILFHVLHQRVPYHSFKFLTECWKNDFKKWIVVDYFLFRAESYIILLEQLDFICRTSELARLFGIQFYEVLSRGSQFRVESMMLRLAKTQNYVAVSPSVRQRAHMRAPESLPLIMEPESKFYTDPIIVLDFQSLYPSIIIAYNYCFSTCLGRIDSLGQNEPFHFGCVEHTVPGDLLVKLENSLNLSAAGVAYVDKTVRKGILPSMLEEILETRLMVKRSMKENKDNSTLKRVLHARQLGLKLIANVTYGYTSANFSGRMPCMEIADSVVSKGRETLERAIELVNGTKEWGARVVYGDTDSLFVLVPNRTKEEAFRIGSEIAEAVTNQNPKPVKLKLEKVYTASILQTKKRYVGYMYESPDQEKPVYDAKGIETVRRDGCPAVSKILEKSLKLLFETKNINTVKQYVQRQFTKLISGRISIQELTFAREYRGMNNYKPAACVPALQLAKQALLKDRRAEPRVKERVRYVIVTGAPGVPLIRLVRTPKDFLDTPGSLINTEYYITRAIIPALERCFNLMNVNVQAWYTEIPKKQKLNLPIDYEFRNKAFKKTNISHYFSSSKCLSCSKVAGGSVCQKCGHKPQRLALILGNMINQWQRKHNNVAKICRSCCGRNEPIGCSSLDCPIYYLFRQTEEDAQQVRYAENLKREYLYF